MVVMDEKIKVLHITLSSSCGGGPEHIRQLLFNLSSTDCQSYLAAPPNGDYIPVFEKIVGRENMIEVPERKLSVKAFFRLINFVKEQGVNIVHSHGKGAGLYGRLLGTLTRCKVVHTFHGLHLQYCGVYLWGYKLLERCLGLLTDASICVSGSEEQKALALHFTDTKRSHRIENGVKQPQVTVAFETDERFKVIHMSRFDFAKNSEMLMPIAKELQRRGLLTDYVFYILGDGENRALCERLLKEAGVISSFYFEGIQRDPRAYLRGEIEGTSKGRAGCYLSTSRWEGLSLAVLEAMSEGVPVVASDVVGNRDAVLDGETGFLFDLTKPEEVVDFLIILQDHNVQKKLSNAGRERISHNFSASVMSRKVLSIYQSLL